MLNYLEIGKRLKIECSERRITQKELAERVDYSGAYLSEIERGLKHPSMELWCDICNELGISLDYLFRGVKLSNSIPADFNECFRELTEDLIEVFRVAMKTTAEQNKNKKKKGKRGL